MAAQGSVEAFSHTAKHIQYVGSRRPMGKTASETGHFSPLVVFHPRQLTVHNRVGHKSVRSSNALSRLLLFLAWSPLMRTNQISVGVYSSPPLLPVALACLLLRRFYRFLRQPVCWHFDDTSVRRNIMALNIYARAKCAHSLLSPLKKKNNSEKIQGNGIRITSRIVRLNELSMAAKCGKPFGRLPSRIKRPHLALHRTPSSNPSLLFVHIPLHHIWFVITFYSGYIHTLAMQLFTALLSALALVSSTTALPAPAAAPARRSENIVFNPPITSPSKGATWKIGSTQTVVWQTSGIPPQGQNNTGHILLGFDDGTGSENLLINTPLASGFLLTSGNHSVTVPTVSPNSTYFVVLLGDSGNKSPYFTISH